MDWSYLKHIIQNNDAFVVTSHIGLDGDAVGSAVALDSYLKRCGKKSVIITQDPIPEVLRFIVNGNETYTADQKNLAEIIKKCDVAFVVDVSKYDHVGEATWQLIQAFSKHVVCIDHHRCDEPLGDYAYIDTTASSVGILLYDLFTAYDPSLIDIPIASALYTTILTDTGNFKFSNTNPHAYKVAGELLQKNINHSAICQAIHENYSWSRFGLLYETLGTLTKEADGKIAWMKITQAALEKTHATFEDSDGFVDIPRTISHVEVSILFREIDNQTTRATFRSKNYVEVNKLAGGFGGGGHARAAGATLNCPIDEAVIKVINQTKGFLHYA
ncbi:DHH family phosphoesterase [bacterium]|nr:DHH family phosphoesterase [bacterium]